jgi:NADPH:quinone reductase-like Zn-dependent oxidoreductase
MYINPLTAFCFTELIRLHKAECIIHTAGSSAVGRMLNKLCQDRGVRVINTVRKSKYLDELNGGLVHTVSSDVDGYRGGLKELCDRYRPNVAFECIGGETTGLVLNNIVENGCLYHYGNLSLRPLSAIMTNDLLFQNKTMKGFWLHRYLKEYPETVNYFLKDLMEKTSLYETNIQAVFKPENFEDAFKTYRQNMSLGKVLFDFNKLDS